MFECVSNAPDASVLMETHTRRCSHSWLAVRPPARKKDGRNLTNQCAIGGGGTIFLRLSNKCAQPSTLHIFINFCKRAMNASVCMPHISDARTVPPTLVSSTAPSIHLCAAPVRTGSLFPRNARQPVLYPEVYTSSVHVPPTTVLAWVCPLRSGATLLQVHTLYSS